MNSKLAAFLRYMWTILKPAIDDVAVLVQSGTLFVGSIFFVANYALGADYLRVALMAISGLLFSSTVWIIIRQWSIRRASAASRARQSRT